MKKSPRTEKSSAAAMTGAADGLFFDMHCHFFNAAYIRQELYFRINQEISDFLGISKKEATRGFAARGIVGWLSGLVRFIRQVRYCIEVLGSSDSTAMCRELDRKYGGGYAFTPLTFDLSWCFQGADAQLKGVARPDFEKRFHALRGELLKQAETTLEAHKGIMAAGKEQRKLVTELEKEKKALLLASDKLSAKLHATKPGKAAAGIRAAAIPQYPDHFDEQLTEILALKCHTAFSGRIFPFLAVDPRRQGILEYAKSNAGKGKPFTAIKLYTPNGYSPTDPVLFGDDSTDDCIYKFCEEHGIPVTVHNSDAGFGSFASKIRINGHVFIDGKVKKLNNEVYKFRNRITSYKKAIQERAYLLNNPSLWELVLQKYPALKLNLAHFGGGNSLKEAMDKPGDKSLWSNKIIRLLLNPAYPNVFTDLSCSSDLDTVERFRNSKVYEEVKDRLLYGSDFWLLLLFEDKLKDNFLRFKEIFGNDYQRIARTNPLIFLEAVI